MGGPLFAASLVAATVWLYKTEKIGPAWMRILYLLAICLLSVFLQMEALWAGLTICAVLTAERYFHPTPMTKQENALFYLCGVAFLLFRLLLR